MRYVTQMVNSSDRYIKILLFCEIGFGTTQSGHYTIILSTGTVIHSAKDVHNVSQVG